MAAGLGSIFRRFRLSTAALALVLAAVMLGVYVATRELNAADEAHATGEAALAMQAAGQVVRELGYQLDPLAKLLSDRGVDSVGVQRIAAALLDSMARRAGEARFVWIGLCRSAADMPSPLSSRCRTIAGHENLDHELPVVFVTRAVDREGWEVAGAVPGHSFEHPMRAVLDYRTRWVALQAGRDTLIAVGEHPQRKRVASQTMRLEGALPRDWRAQVELTPGGQKVRWAVLLVALSSLAGLTLAVYWERREAKRATDRALELQQVSDEMIRSNRVKNEFLANVSHELRTPLNAIVGFTELLREGVYGELNARQKSPVERIEVSASHLRRLVDQILDLAKIAAGRLDVHRETIDLRSFVLDIVTEVEPLVQDRGLSLSIGVGATLPRLQSDPNHLRQILMNLLGNAIKFTERGTIAVRARLVGEDIRLGVDRPSPVPSAEQKRLQQAAPKAAGVATWVAIQVMDSGRGIAPRDLERIFDEFEQVNAGPRSDSMRQGTGLGLTISRRLARLVGGDLTVESVLGSGSTFTLWLPVTS